MCRKGAGGTSLEYMSTPETVTSDRVCTPHPNCTFPVAHHQSGEFVAFAGDVNNPRQCSLLRTCDYDYQYESELATTTSNRVCADLTECDYSYQYVSAPKAESSERACILRESVLLRIRRRISDRGTRLAR